MNKKTNVINVSNLQRIIKESIDEVLGGLSIDEIAKKMVANLSDEEKAVAYELLDDYTLDMVYKIMDNLKKP